MFSRAVPIHAFRIIISFKLSVVNSVGESLILRATKLFFFLTITRVYLLH